MHMGLIRLNGWNGIKRFQGFILFFFLNQIQESTILTRKQQKGKKKKKNPDIFGEKICSMSVVWGDMNTRNPNSINSKSKKS